jgi:hypothetical protein
MRRRTSQSLSSSTGSPVLALSTTRFLSASYSLLLARTRTQRAGGLAQREDGPLNGLAICFIALLLGAAAAWLAGCKARCDVCGTGELCRRGSSLGRARNSSEHTRR